MAQYYNENSFDARTISLMERLHSYFDDASIRAFRPDEQPIPLFKFQSLMLVGEVYEFVRLYAINREEHLSEYFSALSRSIFMTCLSFSLSPSTLIFSSISVESSISFS